MLLSRSILEHLLRVLSLHCWLLVLLIRAILRSGLGGRGVARSVHIF
jgi:hypothetical protein